MRWLAVALLLVIGCGKSHTLAHRDPDALRVSDVIDQGKSLDGKHLKVVGRVHAISSTTSTQHPERRWSLQLVDADAPHDPKTHRTVTCSLAGKPALELRDEVIVAGTAAVWSNGAVLVEPCEIR